MGTFTYIIQPREGKVYGFGLDPSGRELINPQGALRYEGPRRLRVDALSLKAAAGTNPLTESEVKELGQTLFDVLFAEEHKFPFLDFWETYRQAGIRLELDIDETAQPDLAALPWEFLQVTPNRIMGERFLATDPTITFVRRSRRFRSPSPIQLAPGEQLRLLVAVAPPNPELSELAEVDYEGTCHTLQTLAGSHAARLAAPHIVNPATATKIDDSLRSKRHLFHFIGHGRLHNDAGEPEGLLAILGDGNMDQWVNAGEFANLLARNPPPLILLQACEGGASPLSNSMVGVAARLLQHNFPVVIAMQYKITNGTASKFVRKFYERLVEGDPVDQAVQEGRRAIADFNRTRDFATPVIFMQVQDGRLFEWTTPPDATASNQEGRGVQSGDASRSTQTLVTTLYKLMDAVFSQGDLELLCFYMGIDSDGFERPKPKFLKAFLSYCQNDSRLGELLNQCREMRPRTTWPEY